MKRSTPLLLAVALAALLLSACGGSENANTAAQLTVESPALTRLEDGTRLFTGKLYNPTDHPLSGAHVQVTLLDAANRSVGTMNVEVRNIAARDTTGFRQPIDSDADVRSARVRSITVL